MLNSNLLALTPVFTIAGLVAGAYLGKWLHRWLARFICALLMIGALSFLAYFGQYVCYDFDFKNSVFARYMDRDVFNTLCFNFAALFMGAGFLGLWRAIARGRTDQDDMWKDENRHRPSVKMACVTFVLAAFVMLFPVLPLISYLQIEDHTHTKVPLLPFFVAWMPTIAVVIFMVGMMQLKPELEKRPFPRLLKYWLILLGVATFIFMLTGYEF